MEPIHPTTDQPTSPTAKPLTFADLAGITPSGPPRAEFNDIPFSGITGIGSISNDNPMHALWFCVGNECADKGEYRDALKYYAKILAEEEGYPAVWTHAGNALTSLGDEANAEIMYRYAMAYAGDDPDIAHNISGSQRHKGKFEEAAEWALRANQNRLRMDHAANLNAAEALLRLGRFEEGWPYFKKRRLANNASISFGPKTPRDYLPTWNGQPVPEGQGLLLWLEQGVGEEVMFLSCLDDVLKIVPPDQIILAARERLHSLIARSFPGIALCGMDPMTIPKAGFQAALGDLPTLFRHSFADFPRVAYLEPDPVSVAGLREQYGAERQKLIGLSWESPKSATFGPHKGFPVDVLSPVLERDAAFVSLQYFTEEAPLDVADLDRRGIFVDPRVSPRGNVDDYAAQIAAMDLVITSSNTCAHLAGALGVECWVVLPAAKGLLWHWFVDREDSPWYPKVRLFRRGLEEKDWSGVIERVVLALDDKIRQA